jgi:membrane protein implicated in regulation of membrane protease activity
VILLYAPVLLCLPILVVVGIVFVVVPGGFIVVLGGLYWASAEFVGLSGLAASRRRRAARSRTRRARRTSVLVPQTKRRRFDPAGAVAPGASTVALRNDRTPGRAPSLVVHRPRPSGGNRIMSADIGQDVEPQDDARAA